MDYCRSFSALNERLRPRVTTNEQLYSSLNRLEDRQLGSLRNKTSSYRPTVLPAEPETKVSVTKTEAEDPEGREDEEDDLVSDGCEEGNCADLLPLNDLCLITELDLKDVGEEELVDEDSSTSPSEEKDIPGELASGGTSDSSESAAGEGGSSLQRSYINGTLPDLIRSGRPLGRRRTLGHVSDTVSLYTVRLCVLKWERL